jgi:Predicted membrane protein
VNRYVVLYLATLIVLIPIDFLFLGFVAKGFFAAQVGDVLGEIRPAPAILFYLLYVAGILIFVSGPATATWPMTLLYGALFGLFCYATFELTSLSLLRHWTWTVVVVDVSWGVFVTAVSSTLGLMIANWLAPKI